MKNQTYGFILNINCWEEYIYKRKRRLKAVKSQLMSCSVKVPSKLLIHRGERKLHKSKAGNSSVKFPRTTSKVSL